MATKRNKNTNLSEDFVSDTIIDDDISSNVEKTKSVTSKEKKKTKAKPVTAKKTATVIASSDNAEQQNQFVSSALASNSTSFFQPKQKTKETPDQPATVEKVKVGVQDLNNQNISHFYKKFIVVIIVVAVILAGLIVNYTLAKAVISITPKYTEHAISFTAQIVSPDYPKLNEQPDLLIGRKLITEVSQKENFTATANESQKSKKATGQVTIYNKSNKDQALVATTRLTSPDNKLFRLVSTVNVPANGEVQVVVEADQEGDEYLIEPTRFIIPGLWEGLREKIYGESSEKMSFQQITSGLVTQENIDQAITSLTETLKKQALAKFNLEKIDNEKINPDALIATEKKRELSAQVGDQVNNFDLTLTLEFVLITYDEQKLLSKIQNDIDIVSQQNNGLVKHSSNDITLSIKELAGEDKQIIGVITGKYKIQLASPDVDLNQLKGKKLADAQTYLGSLQSIEKFEIKLLPFWLRTIPKLDNHIQIIVNK